METPVEYNTGKKEDNQLRIAIYETTEKIIEGGYGDFYNTLDRKTAIDKMARAICLCDDDSGCKGKCDKKCGVWKHSIPHARAALNALLGAK